MIGYSFGVEGLFSLSLMFGCVADIPPIFMLHDRSVNYFDEHPENGIRFANGISALYSDLTGNVIDFVEDSKTGEKKAVFKKISDISLGESRDPDVQSGESKGREIRMNIKYTIL